ncbi:MAG TPA: hypothetical protein VJW20_11315 [Candidatus Angelobacter sp.]|nr:hypothetical protein [Candidatus Angelobacter sp.]
MNPAQIHSTNASVLSLEERTADAIKEFEMALQLGLPQDDEMKDHFFLGGLYLDTLMSSGISGRDFSASPLFAKAISEMEKALVMDREGGYQYFFEVLNRARLRRLDLLYTLAANSILEHQSRKAAIAFLQRKTGLCVYLPTCPLLNVLFNLAAFCSAEGQTESAKICLKNLLASETVDPVDENGQEAKTRQRALDHLRSPG